MYSESLENVYSEDLKICQNPQSETCSAGLTMSFKRDDGVVMTTRSLPALWESTQQSGALTQGKNQVNNFLMIYAHSLHIFGITILMLCVALFVDA